jgi:hypothetical protein
MVKDSGRAASTRGGALRPREARGKNAAANAQGRGSLPLSRACVAIALWNFGRANRYEFETSSVNICTLTPIFTLLSLEVLYAMLRVAKILEVGGHLFLFRRPILF